MGDSEQWRIDDNGYYLTNYKYTAPRTSPYTVEESLYSNDTNPIYHKITFEEPINITLKYAIGMMYAGYGTSPSAGLYYDYKTTDGHDYVNTPLAIDRLGEASEINTIVNNDIVLTEREVELENITELTLKSISRPVLWVDYIQIEVLE